MRYYQSSMSGGLPPVVKNLLIVNGLLLLLKIVVGSDAMGGSLLDRYLGLHAIGSPDFKPWQIITHMFMHAGPSGGDKNWFFHIGSNMFALYMFGSPIERLWGPKRFITYYLLCGLGAAALQMGVNYAEIAPTLDAVRNMGVDPADVKRMVIASHTSLEDVNAVLMEVTQKIPAAEAPMTKLFWEYYGVMIGASGAIFGVLLAFGMFFPNTELMLLFFPVPIKAKYFVIGYGLIELFMGVRQGAGDNVAHYAHLGGMIFGFFLIHFWRRKGVV